MIPGRLDASKIGPTIVVLVLLLGGTVQGTARGEAATRLADGPLVEGTDIHVRRFAADVDVTDALARTRLEIVLANRADVDREATMRVPLPPTATLDAFNMTIGNTTYEGRVLERGRARDRYENATRQGRQAVLLHQADEDGVVATVHVAPGQRIVLRAAYVEHLPMEQGRRVYRLPTSRLTLDNRTIDQVRVDVDATSRHGIQAVATAGLDFDHLTRTADHLSAETAIDDAADLGDVDLRWKEGGGAWLPSAIAADRPGSSGSSSTHLLVSVALRRNVTRDVLPRDVVFVVDDSGSMSGSKIDQAKGSLDRVISDLGEQDRFAVVSFDDDVRVLTEGLVQADPATIDRARSRVASLDAGGSTDLDAALQRALGLLDTEGGGERVPLVVLVTDGLPTAGVTDPRRIVERTGRANTRGAAIHPIAIGVDADTTFLKDLALETGGHLVELAPGADLQARLSGYFAELEDPLATDLDVDVTGVPHGDVLPTTLPTLYPGDSLTLLMPADLSQPGPIHVNVTGRTVDGTFSRSLTVDEVRVDPAIDRLWGRAHVDALLSEQRMEGRRPGLRQAIVDNATRYGVVTPHTSWVVVEPEPDVQAQPQEGEDGPVHAPSAGDTDAVRSTPTPTRQQAPSRPGHGADRPTVPGFGVAAVLGALAGAAVVWWIKR